MKLHSFLSMVFVYIILIIAFFSIIGISLFSMIPDIEILAIIF